MCQRALHINAMLGMIFIWFGWADTESYKDLGDENRGVQEGQYFTVLTGPISYGIHHWIWL